MNQFNFFPEIENRDLKSAIITLEDENSMLRDQLKDLNSIISQLAKPILKRLVRSVEKQLRKFPEEARQFGDDSKLNFFEEVCVMFQEVSMDDYLFVESTISDCCDDAYSGLSLLEQKIIDQIASSRYDSVTELIFDEFKHYANNYSNLRIEYALDVRL